MGALMIPPTVKLTAQEQKALEDWERKQQPGMSPVTAANFFLLFAEGYSLEEINRSNQSWSLGCLVHARLLYKWDERLATYIEDVHKQAFERLNKFKAEAVNHILDTLLVSHKISRDEMMRYIQNPTDENLPRNARLSPRDYKDLLDSLERVIKIGQPAIPPPAPQTPVSIIAGPGSTVVAGDSSGAMSSLMKLAEEQRARAKS
jgi:hypothetical protein